ncbi:ATP-binding protein [Frateuria soli]|uniref:ATP-binding protein n=1 Tax=Frateuria soli TaxID=1542730 RepID=UPI001E368378|nr:ATP-binding protein [Frateuria soli]UGB37944.1 ATP-binding protein [Frateuria soli]
MKRAPSTFALVLVLVAAALLLALVLSSALQRRFGRQVVSDSYGRLALATALATDELASRPQDPAARRVLGSLRLLGVHVSDGQPPASSVRRIAPALAAVARTVGTALGDPSRVVATQTPDSQLWVRSARDPARWIVLRTPSYRSRLLDSALSLSVFAALIALAAAGLAARLVTRPLERLAAQAPGLLAGAPTGAGLEGSPREVRRLADAIGNAGERLRAVARERELMLAGISHDLRTPLARLRLALELGDAGDPVRRDAMVADLEELDGALEQCLAFVREGRDEALLPTDLATLAGQLLALRLQPDDWQLESPAEVTVPVRPTLLRRALGNLIDNAERYGAPPFAVTLARMDKAIEIRVTDRGSGVPPGLLGRLGQPFLRGDPARGGGGSGLGLSIAARAAHWHGGELLLANRTGGGLAATLRFSIPTCTAAAPPARKHSGVSPP